LIICRLGDAKVTSLKKSVEHVRNALELPGEDQGKCHGLAFMVATWLCSSPEHLQAVAQQVAANKPVTRPEPPQLHQRLEVDVRGAVDVYDDNITHVQVAVGEIKADAGWSGGMS